MKKIIKVLFVVMILMIAITVFTACENILPEMPSVDGGCAHVGGIATCEEQAVCQLCGEPYGEKSDVHTPETIPAVEPTCMSVGFTSGTKCSVCGLVLEAQERLEAGDHTMVDRVGLAATCTEDGYTSYKKCSVCGLEEDKTVVPAGHDFVADEVSGNSVCSSCGLIQATTLEGLVAALATEAESINIVIDANIDVTASLEVVKNTVITLGEGTISNASMTAGRMFEIKSGAHLTFNAGENDVALGGYGFVQFSADITNAGITVNGGSFTGNLNSGAFVRLRAGNENLTVNLNGVKGDFEGAWLISTSGVNKENSLTLNIDSCDLKVDLCGLELYNTNATIKGSTITADTDWALLASGTINIDNCKFYVTSDGANSGGVTAGLAISGNGTLNIDNSSVTVTWDDTGSYPHNVVGLLVCNSGGHIVANNTEINLVGSDEMKTYRADVYDTANEYSIIIDGQEVVDN